LIRDEPIPAKERLEQAMGQLDQMTEDDFIYSEEVIDRLEDILMKSTSNWIRSIPHRTARPTERRELARQTFARLSPGPGRPGLGDRSGNRNGAGRDL